jgi:hypothetical protein
MDDASLLLSIPRREVYQHDIVFLLELFGHSFAPWLCRQQPALKGAMQPAPNAGALVLCHVHHARWPQLPYDLLSFFLVSCAAQVLILLAQMQGAGVMNQKVRMNQIRHAFNRYRPAEPEIAEYEGSCSHNSSVRAQLLICRSCAVHFLFRWHCI